MLIMNPRLRSRNTGHSAKGSNGLTRHAPKGLSPLPMIVVNPMRRQQRGMLCREYAGKSIPFRANGEDKEVVYLTRVDPLTRSEERRVGKEGRSRWSPYH